MIEIIVSVTFFVLALVIILRSIRIVPQGFNWTVERFGKYTRTVTPGLNFLVPIVESVGRKFNMMEQVLDVPPQDVISSDNAPVNCDAVCFYMVLDAAKSAYAVNELTLAMRNLVMTNIRAVLGSMELDEALSNRDKINASLLEKVDDATDPWGVKVTRVEIRDVSPPHDILEAMATQMKAEREKRAEILDAEGKREADIQRAEGQKQSQILEAEGQRQAEITQAEGQKQSAILRAEGELEAAKREAEARERLADAEAKATEFVSKAIENGDSRAVSYFIAQQYVEALGKLAESSNNKVMMIPLEASSVIGSLAGISEVAKDFVSSGKAESA